jgi:hypothetical protein
MKVIDPPSPFSADCEQRRAKLFTDLTALRGNVDQVVDFELFSIPKQVKAEIEAFLASTNGRLILDISALPKRFFFPVLKWLTKSPIVRDLVVTYSTPERYHSGELAFEPGEWAHIPTFQSLDVPPLKKAEKVIVGVGFIPFGLPGLLKDNHADADVVLIFPFPPGAPHVQRNWQFVTEIDSVSQLGDDRNIRRIHINDMPACYCEIDATSNNGSSRTVFAPYGPKPHSLAMCLFSIAHECDVFYTQPRFYHPEYSSGIALENGRPKGTAYLVKLDGAMLY